MIVKKDIFGIIFFFSLFSLGACQPEETANEGPILISSIPANDETGVVTSTILVLNFSERFTLIDQPQITLNGLVVNTTLTYKKLTISTPLSGNTDYVLDIPAKTLYDDAGSSNKRIQLHFTTKADVSIDGTLFEAETATLSGSAAIATTNSGYSGSGYVFSGDGNVTFHISIVQDGFYALDVRFHTSGNNRVNDLYVDGVKTGALSFEPVSVWTTLQAGKIRLTAGNHTLSLVKNWGYTAYDYIVLRRDTVGMTPFHIAANLVTPNPSLQAIHLYNFLKENFGNKVLSGTAAAHSTNINEAIWVHDQTGKWPAITCFDFLDHTWKSQNWVNYSAPFTLGQEWWNNNGIVALMWHWRDPLTKSGSMYTYSSSNTSGTTFDLSKIADTTSNEYKAMIVDLDVIAGYLKEFKDANIPVLWRPLHEASGTWFWWGAKGAEPCKSLWKLMYNRFVKVHGLNNLIWVWTSDVAKDATAWYPGDDYVDIIGMDIYPGENQHQSQYFSYNKIREMFGGTKLITLSECGSIPDPNLMKMNGDMWSYFMPWNGDYTRSDAHNGVNWWKALFANDLVVTRDEMPNLK